MCERARLYLSVFDRYCRVELDGSPALTEICCAEGIDPILVPLADRGFTASWRGNAAQGLLTFRTTRA